MGAEFRAGPIFEELAATLEGVAEALEEGDRKEAEAVLGRARQLDERVRSLDEALSAGYETARLSPTRRRSLTMLVNRMCSPLSFRPSLLTIVSLSLPYRPSRRPLEGILRAVSCKEPLL